MAEHVVFEKRDPDGVTARAWHDNFGGWVEVSYPDGTPEGRIEQARMDARGLLDRARLEGRVSGVKWHVTNYMNMNLDGPMLRAILAGELVVPVWHGHVCVPRGPGVFRDADETEAG